MTAQAWTVVATLISAIVGAIVLLWRARIDTKLQSRSGNDNAYVALIEALNGDRDAARQDRDQWKGRATSAEQALRECQQATWEATAILREVAGLVRTAAQSKLKAALEPVLARWAGGE